MGILFNNKGANSYKLKLSKRGNSTYRFLQTPTFPPVYLSDIV